MEILLTSALVVALAEIGDKTMLLAIVLATRFRRPWPIIGGILAATIANHGLAAWAGSAIAGLLDGFWFRLVVALGFLAMAAWTLVPDTLDVDAERPTHHGVFLTTLIAFFIVEIGDKTQVATVALGAHYHAVLPVAAGTTIGMLAINMPSVLFGERITRVVPIRTVHFAAAAIFALLGTWSLFELFPR